VGDRPFEEQTNLEPAVYLSQASAIFATFDAGTQDSGNVSSASRRRAGAGS